jgi:hypothetical protein
MNPNEAAAATKRVSELWPTTTSTQIEEATRALLKPEYAFKDVVGALSSMYENGQKFFEWGELRARCIHTPPRPDRETLIAPHRQHELEIRREQMERQQRRDEARYIVDHLTPEERDDFQMLFLSDVATRHPNLPGAVDVYADMFAKRMLPPGFCAFVMERKTGRAVA